MKTAPNPSQERHLRLPAGILLGPSLHFLLHVRLSLVGLAAIRQCLRVQRSVFRICLIHASFLPGAFVMSKIVASFVAVAVCCVSFVANVQGAEKVGPALEFKMKNIQGEPVDLSKYQGKVVLMVNVASKCGLTRQYEQLEGLHEKYADKGLAVLGFPANEFLGQEPGTDAQIADFCKAKYDVKFDMFSKVVVKGEGQCPLYKFLTSKDTDPKFAGDITWNFEKFLVGRDGNVVARFSPKVLPDAPEVIKAIEEALAEKK
jgi:glutathione peroxidase